MPVPAEEVNLRLVAHAGFTGASETADATNVRMTYATLSSAGLGPPSVTGETSTDLIIPGGPMGQLEDTLTKPLDHDLLIVVFDFEGGAVSEELVPALFGLRLHRL